MPLEDEKRDVVAVGKRLPPSESVGRLDDALRMCGDVRDRLYAEDG